MAERDSGERKLERRAVPPARPPGPPGLPRSALLLLALLAAAAVVLASRGGGVEPFALLLLLPALLPLPLAAGPAVGGLGAVALLPLVLHLLGRAPGLAPGAYAAVAVPCWAASALALSRIARLRGKVRVLREDLGRLGATDPLSGAASRLELVRQGQQLVQLARRGSRELAVLAVDVDGLRHVNEQHGQAMGDEVIRTVAARLRDALRTTDVVGRTGSGAFGVVMPDTRLEGARTAAERARAAVADDGLFADGSRQEIRFTVSIGIAPLGADDADFEALLRRADAALDAAKEAGRNRLAVAR